MRFVTGRGQDPGLALIEGPKGTRHEVCPDRLTLPGPSSWKNRAERSRQGLRWARERSLPRSAGPRASSREGRVGPVPARDLEGVWGQRGNQGVMQSGPCPGALCPTPGHWVLGFCAAGGSVPRGTASHVRWGDCGHEGSSPPSSRNVPCLFVQRETAPGFYGNSGYLKMSQTVRRIQNRVFKMTFCMSDVTLIF